jgi:TP901 family phage tail tape measure protein
VATVANLFIRIAASSTEFEKSLKSAEAQFNRTGAKLQSVGANLTKSVTLPIAAIGGLAIKAAADFESSFAGIRKTVGGTENELSALAHGMREMAKIKPVNVNELNRIGEIGGQLGIATDGILDFTDVVADMTIATDLTVEAAASGLARIATLTDTPKEGFRALGDTIAALGDAGSSTEADIVAFGERLAGAGHLAGFSANEILATGAAMANLGIEAEAGGTAVQKVWISMIEAVQEGGKQLEAFGNAAGGISGGAFKELFNAAPGEAFLRFVEGLEKSGRGAINILKDLGIEDQRQLRAFLGLASASGTLRAAFDAAANSSGKLKHEVDIFTNTAKSQLTLLLNAANDVAITFGQQLLPQLLKLKPALLGAIEIVAGLVKWFAELPQPVQQWAIALVGLAAALGPVAYGLGTMEKGIAGLFGLLKVSGVAGVIGSMVAALAELGAMTLAFGWEGFGVAIAGWGPAIVAGMAAHPVLTFVGAVITLTIALKELSSAWDNMSGAVGRGGGWTSKGGWKAFFGEIGRNSKDDSMSFFKDWRAPMGAPAGMKPMSSHGGAGVAANDPVAKARAEMDRILESLGIGPAGKPKIPGAGGDDSPIAKAAKSISESMKNAVAQAQAWNSEVQRQGGIDKATAYAKGQLADALGEVVEKYGSLEKAGLGAMGSIYRATKKTLESTRAINTTMAALTGPNGIAGNLGGMMGQFESLQTTDNTASTSNFLKGSLGQYNSLQDLANQFGMSQGATPTVETLNVTEQVVEYVGQQTAQTAKETVDSLRSAFQYFTGSLSSGMAAMLGGIMNSFEKAANKEGSGLQKWLSKNPWLAGAVDIGMGAFGGGFAMGEGMGKGKGALAGAGSGALTGLMAGGPIGAAIGGIAGLIGGLFGGGKKKREEQAKMADAKAQLLDQFGSMEELQKVAQRAGVSVDLLFSTTKAKEFQGEMDRVTAAIEEMQKRVATTVGEIDKVMAKGGLIGKELWGSILRDQDAEEIKAKLEEVFAASVERSAEGFGKIAMNFELLKRPINEIGVLADAAFAGLLAGGASIPEAIAQMGDGLAHIQELLAGSGQAASGPLATLLNYQAITQANQGLFELLSGVDDMLTGLGNSGLLTQERFTALGATIAQAFGQLQTQGVAAGTALELMQPQLQKLWEAQQMFGLKTDAATQALIDQAVTQGLVGQNMKDVNSQILDVLKAIATVLGAEIPGALAALPGQVQEAATAFTGIKIPDIKVGVRPNWKDWDWPEQPGGATGGTGVKPMATGGIVTRPTHALIGEAGPEAVIPLDEFDMNRGGINIGTVYGTVDRAFVKMIGRTVAQGGDVKTIWQGAIK